MFIRANVVKKLVKQAYKEDELVLGTTETKYILMGRFWELLVERKRLDNKIKAQVVELGLMFPEVNKTCKCGASKETWLETEVEPEEVNRRFHIPDMDKNCIISNVLYEKKGKVARLIQTSEGAVRAIPESTVSAVNQLADGIEGPVAQGEYVWMYDENMILKIRISPVDKEKVLLEAAERIKLEDRLFA